MAYRWLGVLILGAACVVGCSGTDGGDPRVTGGTGGTAGTGGQAGTGGTAGTGGSEPIECTTSLICRSCPTGPEACETNGDCAVGSVCIESGCDDPEGAPIKQCVFAGGGACTSNAMCPEGRECLEVPGSNMRCVRTAPGCDSNFDCVKGFTCEDGSCVDRRVPCDLDEHCPMNHTCVSTGNATFCVRIQTDCSAPFDCVDVAPSCVDIDGDGNSECAGTFDPNDPLSDACTNALCADGASPVCQASGVGSTAQCGQYGLCLDDNDCANGFGCVGLWPDGRKECVPTDGAACSSYLDCGVREVCASPREGGPPDCQTGFEP